MSKTEAARKIEGLVEKYNNLLRNGKTEVFVKSM